MFDSETTIVWENKEYKPLFVDVGVEIICAGAFKWIFDTDLKYFSYFPILVHPKNFPNLYIVMSSLDIPNGKKDDSEIEIEIEDFSQIKSNAIQKLKDRIEGKKIKLHSVSDFNPYLYECNEDEATILFLKNQDHINIKQIAEDVLNPIGIGVFDLPENNLEIMNHSDSDYFFVQSPFSMEIIDNLIYNFSYPYKKSDILITDALTISSLVYPLRPLSLPSYDENKLLDKVILKCITNKNPLDYISHALERHNKSQLCEIHI